MSEPLDKRRRMLEKKVLPKLKEPVRYSQTLDARLDDLISSVKAAGLERRGRKKGSSRYEHGIRSRKVQKLKRVETLTKAPQRDGSWMAIWDLWVANSASGVNS